MIIVQVFPQARHEATTGSCKLFLWSWKHPLVHYLDASTTERRDQFKNGCEPWEVAGKRIKSCHRCGNGTCFRRLTDYRTFITSFPVILYAYDVPSRISTSWNINIVSLRGMGEWVSLSGWTSAKKLLGGEGCRGRVSSRSLRHLQSRTTCHKPKSKILESKPLRFNPLWIRQPSDPTVFR